MDNIVIDNNDQGAKKGLGFFRALPGKLPGFRLPAIKRGDKKTVAKRSSEKEVKKPPSFADVIAGATARAGSQSAIHPIDTIKVRMQAPSTGAGGSSLFVGSNAAQQFGSLYKGVGGAASGAGIAIGAYFAFYGAATDFLKNHTDLSIGAVAFCAGAVGAAGSSLVKVPAAVCIRSVQANVYPNVFKAAKTIVATAGPRGLYTGFVPTLLEDIPDMAIKFAAYEVLRATHCKITGKSRGEAAVHEDLIMGGGAGALAAAGTTPLDVIKTRMMCSASTRPTVLASAAEVYKGGGSRAFFTGVKPRALSNGLNSAVFFCFFEAIRAHLKVREANQLAAAQAKADADETSVEAAYLPKKSQSRDVRPEFLSESVECPLYQTEAQPASIAIAMHPKK
mmetsp:Transcript_24158/g.29286  ORF Transcript_24158/g.29286 Transcript_24158/m.29286 type:complete len:393 (+) Transcript_24158:703-1881(+)|eukprot:CAMPEP_0197851516 /NCGR_PEP_ID=MMETSP1438-20131217/18257_1 /TAXON_ID=1461541 /ORGANISM="Pterosperma sp., Strain CCMP1384" /LENGTH=392 /DNA_ID=CAMNT_0043465137 /DNA_START=692 /DNA_END=1870 /DNA_ORIENTATION=-